MATIADTLNDIQKLQNAISSKIDNCEELAGDMFVQDLMNFTTIYFFSLLSHATLDTLKVSIQPIHHPYADKYYSMYEEKGVLQELIRWDNISGIFLLWNIFEKHVDKTRANLLGNCERDLEGRYKKILQHVGVDQTTYNTMVNEFNLIRLTRNSLHGGGVYRNKKKRNFMLKGKQYVLEKDKHVIPIRLMDIAETMWQHFLILVEDPSNKP